MEQILKYKIPSSRSKSMTATTPACLVCGQTSEIIPLLALTYQGQQHWICPSDLPVLIHKPGELVNKLPGAANLKPHEH
jgi:hypothetical protein